MARQSLSSLVSEEAAKPADETREETTAANEQQHVTVTKQDKGTSAPSGEPASRRPSRPGMKAGTVYTPEPIFDDLRAHVAKRKARGEELTYGKACLLAVQQHRHELANLWTEPAQETGGDDLDDDLFGVTVSKIAPKKVPWQLHGVSPAQLGRLDQLATQWQAPSRSVLIEEALRRYLAPRKRSPQQAD